MAYDVCDLVDRSVAAETVVKYKYTVKIQMEAGHITEIFSSFQGEGPYAGKRQIFIRFAGCHFSCFYCDTSSARDPKPRFCNLLLLNKETYSKRNPLSTNAVIDCVKDLLTPDLHSISYTGGEPLTSHSFVKEIATEAKVVMHLKNFIETNGYSATAFASLVDSKCFDFASIDIKLMSHRAVEEKDYENLYSNAMDCVKISADRGIETIVKIVVIRNTAVDEIEKLCDDLAGFNSRLKFVLQPVNVNITTQPHLHRAGIVPDIEELFKLSEIAGRILPDVMVLPQVHKFMRIP